MRVQRWMTFSCHIFSKTFTHCSIARCLGLSGYPASSPAAAQISPSESSLRSHAKLRLRHFESRFNYFPGVTSPQYRIPRLARLRFPREELHWWRHILVDAAVLQLTRLPDHSNDDCWTMLFWLAAGNEERIHFCAFIPLRFTPSAPPWMVRLESGQSFSCHGPPWTWPCKGVAFQRIWHPPFPRWSISDWNPSPWKPSSSWFLRWPWGFFQHVSCRREALRTEEDFQAGKPLKVHGIYTLPKTNSEKNPEKSQNHKRKESSCNQSNFKCICWEIQNEWCFEHYQTFRTSTK